MSRLSQPLRRAADQAFSPWVAEDVRNSSGCGNRVATLMAQLRAEVDYTAPAVHTAGRMYPIRRLLSGDDRQPARGAWAGKSAVFSRGMCVLASLD